MRLMELDILAAQMIVAATSAMAGVPGGPSMAEVQVATAATIALMARPTWAASQGKMARTTLLGCVALAHQVASVVQKLLCKVVRTTAWLVLAERARSIRSHKRATRPHLA